MEWDKAIKLKDVWLNNYTNNYHHSNTTFNVYLKGCLTISVRVQDIAVHSEIDLILSAYKLFETLSDEEQIHVTLMGW